MQAFYLAASQAFFFQAMDGDPLAIAFRFAPSEVFFNAYDESAAKVLLHRVVSNAKPTIDQPEYGCDKARFGQLRRPPTRVRNWTVPQQ